MNSITEPSATLPPPTLISNDGVPAGNVLDLEQAQTPQFEQRQSRHSSFLARFSTPLPPKHHSRVIRHARHTFLNVYRRLFSIVFLFNLIGLFIVSANYRRYSKAGWLTSLTNASAANVMVALLIRQDYVVNICFR